jgi:hypothetical protein
MILYYNMKKKENIFYLIFILSIFIIRIEVFLFPSNKIIVDGLRINHFWIGVVLILIVILLSKRYDILRTILFPIGLGIVADELTFMVLGSRTINDYWSIYSLSGVLIFTVIVFVLRKKIVDKIYK